MQLPAYRSPHSEACAHLPIRSYTPRLFLFVLGPQAQGQSSIQVLCSTLISTARGEGALVALQTGMAWYGMAQAGMRHHASLPFPTASNPPVPAPLVVGPPLC